MPRPARRRLRRQLALLRLHAALSTGVLVLLASSGFRAPGRQVVDVLDVHRINVLNPDGGLALAVAGKGGLPGPTFEGREYPQSLSGGRTDASGMIFFNERGDEVGGLTFAGRLTEGGHRAGGGLTFDQFRQDQVVSLQYQDDGTSRRAGVHVWDRSAQVGIGELLDLLDARSRATGAELDALNARLQGLVDTGLGSHRVFLGSRNRTAALELEDTRGRPRIRLSVDSLDVPRLDFLDGDGAVVATFPGGR